MSAKVWWLFIFVILYWGYCIYWGLRASRMARTASDYFIAGRRLSLWVFVLASTATSFSAWTFMGHPGLIFRDGFPYAFISFYAIAIPFTGVIFLKRQWMLGKRYGYVTPGEMLSDYFQGDAIRVLTVIIAVLFSVPYLGVQLAAAGYLFNVLSDGLIPNVVGMLVLAFIVWLYVATGGLRAVAYVDTVQCVLLALGIIIIGVIALNAVGGWESLNAYMAELARVHEAPVAGSVAGPGRAGEHYFAIPGAIQLTAGLGHEAPVGGLWTGTMILTFLIGMMGIQSAPAYTMWAFSNNNPAPFAPQQVWASSFGIGFLLIVFSAIQGMAAHFLGADPMASQAGLKHADVLPPTILANPDTLVPAYINLMADAAPWLIGLLAVCALAAMQSTGAAYMSTAGAIITRDLYKRYLNPRATHATQKLFGRLSVTLIVLLALLVAAFSRDTLVLLGGHAVAFGLQMWVPLIAVCYAPWITRQGATWGLAAGTLAVILTDSIGQTLLGSLLPWGRWPLTIHSAGWGIAANVAVCVVVSALTQDERQNRHRQKVHSFLTLHGSMRPGRRRFVPIAWLATLGWLFFAVGPGAIIGNEIFGAPQDGTSGWMFGIPSIWAWQILFWVLGVGLIWFLAYFLEMGKVPASQVDALIDDIGDVSVITRTRGP